MLRLIATTSLAALLLAACAPPAPDAAEPAGETEAAVVPAGAAEIPSAGLPAEFALTYENENDTAQTSFDIDPAIPAFDESLAARLWADATEEVAAFALMADTDRKTADAEAASSGNETWFRLYSLDITHRASAVLDDVISVATTLSNYTGGAHPNYAMTGHVYRKGETAPLGLETFITDRAAFNNLVIAALVEEKLLRGYEASASDSVEAELREQLTPSAEVPEIYQGRFVLEPSTETGKAGGISVLFSPYDVGSYAEGAYVATVTAADLAPILTETWSGRFGGEPVLEREAP